MELAKLHHTLFIKGEIMIILLHYVKKMWFMLTYINIIITFALRNKRKYTWFSRTLLLITQSAITLILIERLSEREAWAAFVVLCSIELEELFFLSLSHLKWQDNPLLTNTDCHLGGFVLMRARKRGVEKEWYFVYIILNTLFWKCPSLFQKRTKNLAPIEVYC